MFRRLTQLMASRRSWSFPVKVAINDESETVYAEDENAEDHDRKSALHFVVAYVRLFDLLSVWFHIHFPKTLPLWFQHFFVDWSRRLWRLSRIPMRCWCYRVVFPGCQVIPKQVTARKEANVTILVTVDGSNDKHRQEKIWTGKQDDLVKKHANKRKQSIDEIAEQLRKLRDELDDDWNDAWQFVPKPKAKTEALEVTQQTGNDDDIYDKKKRIIVVEEKEEEKADEDTVADAKEVAWKNHLLESERVEL